MVRKKKSLELEHLGDPNDYENLTRFREFYSLSNGYTIGSESCEILEQLEQLDSQHRGLDLVSYLLLLGWSTAEYSLFR